MVTILPDDAKDFDFLCD